MQAVAESVNQTTADKVHVLMVEDEFLISLVVADALEEQGLAVHTVDNAADALAYIQSGVPVDVLFTDIELPGGVNGKALALLVRALRPDLPIVFASGTSRADDLREFCVRSAFLPKPYRVEQAGRIIQQMMRAA
jgi:DNA-binding NtrC family response regulator